MERETRLRETLVAQLERGGVLRSPSVAAAMRAVPRHLFLPMVRADETYADQAIALKVDGDEILSSISQPSMIVQMLELLEVRPGDRILEVGTGSGYNAALLSHLAGPTGSVTSVEIDLEMYHRASADARGAWIRSRSRDRGRRRGRMRTTRSPTIAWRSRRAAMTSHPAGGRRCATGGAW